MISNPGRPAAPPLNLSALSWVLGDLSQSLPLATLCLQRAARDAQAADDFGTDLADDGNLRTAIQQIRQAAGALTIIGYAEIATVLSAAEAASEFFLHTRGSCTIASIAPVSRACIAVINFLQAKLGGYIGSPVALFPCYRDVKKIYSTEYCHPADLWPHSWHLHPLAPWTLEPVSSHPALAPDAGLRFDQALLGCMRTGDSASAELAAQLCGDLAGTQEDPVKKSYWYAAAGFFEAIQLQLLATTAEVKRSMTDIRTQFLDRHASASPKLDRLTRELVFFCACARLPPERRAPWLGTVRRVYGVDFALDLDYTSDFFSRRDPQQVALARRRRETLAESWNALVSGQNNQLPKVREQFALFCELLVVLEPKSSELTHAVAAYLDELQETGAVPNATMAMEIAFALLALESACEMLLPAPKLIAQQFAELKQRLATARTTHRHAPLADWMAHTLRRSISGSAMNKLTRALHTEFRQIELDIEHYFSTSREIVSLSDACIRLVQVGGVLTLLDLQQAHHATQHMHAQITAEMMHPSAPGNAPTQAPASWAANLGNLGVLADMLAYQLALAQIAFRFDATRGELVFQTNPDTFALQPNHTAIQALQTPAQAALAVSTAPLYRANGAAAANTTRTPTGPGEVTPSGAPDQPLAADDDEEILSLFLGEARAVIGQAKQAIAQAAHADMESGQEHNLHAIRRAFHTIKGGARMVGLQAVGESAWAFEQLIHAQLLQPQNPLADVLHASDNALTNLLQWVEAISSGAPTSYSDTEFREAADALRLRSNPPLAPQDDRATESHLPSPAPEAAQRPSSPKPKPHTQALLQVFAAEAAERIQRIQEQLDHWKTDAEPGHPHAIRDLAHALRGGAATVRCSGLETLAHALESCMESLVPGTDFTKARQQLLHDCVTELNQLLRRFIDGYHDAPQTRLLSALQTFGLNTNDTAPTNTEAAASTPLLPQALPPAADIDPDADAPDAELWPIFQEEAQELFQALGVAFDDWTLQTESPDAPGRVRRLLHTLKGSARLAGAMHLGALAHDLESYLSDLPEGQASAAEIARAREALDAMQARFNQYQPASAIAAHTLPDHGPADHAVQLVHPTLRIRAQELDHLLDQSSEVLVVRARMQSRTDDLLVSLETMAHNAARLREQLRELEMQSELQMQSRSNPLHRDTSDLDPLELDRFTRLQEITRMMAESHDDLGTVQRALRVGLVELDRDLSLQNRQAREIHQDILSMRLVAFDDIASRLYAVVRQAARHAGKSVRLDITGGSTRLDRSLLHRVAPCLEHLLRNAVVHGVEAAPARLEAGKAVSGLIGVAMAQAGQDICIDVWDDGAGLHTERIRAKAIEKSLWPADAPLTDEQALALLLKPGFSTSEDVTLDAGRGIGMDVVQSEGQALGGQLAIHTESGKGMRFSMVFPLTTGLTQVAVFRVGNSTFGVPSAMVVQMADTPSPRAPASGVEHAFLDLGDLGQVERFWAGDLLEVPEPSAEQAGHGLSTVVFSSTGRTVALQVDQALGEREMTIKSLGPQLSGLPGLIGAGVLPSAELVLIYNPVALATVYGDAARSRQAERSARARANHQRAGNRDMRDAPVLVVDDSITMRRVTERLLLREGVRVVLASDGLDALEKLKTVYPAVIVSDIEMPRLDGFDLVRRIRADARIADIPIIIISSRVAQKHQDIATQLGANHYLGKPFREAELLALVRRYCGEKSPA